MTEPEIARWTTYGKELHKFIRDPKNGMWLEATQYLDPSGKNHHIPGAAFYLTSGRYRGEFISMWEMFDHATEFDTCIDMLVERAEMIYHKERSFNTIVTCTHTAREIVRHLRPRLGVKLRHDIEVSEFGHYPHDSPDQLENNTFRSRRVLIFTDVMASGTLVRDMALSVARTGGEVVGILTIVLCDEEMSRKLTPQGTVAMDVETGIEGRRSELTLHALTGIEVVELKEGDFDPSRLRKIDFVTVFPEAPTFLEEEPRQADSNIPEEDLIQARFLRHEMQVHFQETDALIHGHFASDNRHFTLGVRINKLLTKSKVADEIWQRIRKDCKGEPDQDLALICTFKKNNLLFTHFVRDRLLEEGLEVPYYVMKRELGDFPHLHQALYPHTHKVTGKSVILLRATATTSEELRSIAALLAAENVKRITVICLVNRMGKYTVSFVRRVKELVTTHPGIAVFNFVQIYHLTDLRTDDLAEMQRRADSVLDRYTRVTEVPYFKFLAEDFREAMNPVSADTVDFDAPQKNDLARILADLVHEMSEHRIDNLLALIRRQENELGASLKEIPEGEIYLPLARLIIADVDYIRLSKNLHIIMKCLHERLEDLRSERFDEEEEFHRVYSSGFSWDEFESSPSCQRIIGNLYIETQLIFCLALLSHFDKNNTTVESLLEDVLFGNRTLEQWRKHPLNLRYHFREPKSYWLSSFMLHAIHPDFFTHPNGVARRLDVARWLQVWFDDLLSDLPPSAYMADNGETLLEGQIWDMKNHLLLELGAYARGLWHQRIRFLHHHLLHRSEGHSPIWTALKSLETDYEIWLETSGSIDLILRLPRHSQEALNAAMTLREIAQAAHHLSTYPNHEVSEALKAQFGNPNIRDSFELATVSPLIEWIKNHQDTPPADEEDFEEFKNLVWKVKQVVFDAACALRTGLFHFCVPLDQVLMDAMSSVNLRLAAEGYTQVWIKQLDRLRYKQGNHSYLMLCEPHLLLEVLRNLLSNVRYAVDEDHKQDLNSEHIRLHIESRIDKLPEPEGGEHEFIFLVVETEGLSYSERTEGGIQVGGTFRSHQARIMEFGGNLSISDGLDAKGSRAELKLISRINYNGIAEN